MQGVAASCSSAPICRIVPILSFAIVLRGIKPSFVSAWLKKTAIVISVLFFAACSAENNGNENTDPENITLAPATSVTASSEPIYLLIRGQSNAIGIPEEPLRTSYVPSEDIKFWHHHTKEWRVASLTTIPRYGRAGTYTFALSAAKTLNEYYNRPVYYISNARNGAKFDRWLDEGKGNLFDLVVRKVQKSGAKNVIVLSHQGEAHWNESADVFLDKVHKYEALLKSQDWFSGLIIHGEFLYGGAKEDGPRDTHNPQIRTLDHFVSAKGLTASTSVHFDSESLEELGKRYAKEVIKSGVVK